MRVYRDRVGTGDRGRERRKGVAKTAGDVAGVFFLDEEGAERFVLTLQGELRGEEEFLVRGVII